MNARKLIAPDDDPPDTAVVLETHGEPLLVTDPTYIADYFNLDDSHSHYLREHGVVLSNFGGDLPCSVHWDDPYLVAAFSDAATGPSSAVLAEDVAIDSGCLLFLPLTPAIPADLRALIDEALQTFGAAAVSVPAGRWQFFYEEMPDDEADGHRNIVAQWTRSSLTSA